MENKNETLNVWQNHTLVGKLWCDAHGKLGFHYDKKWLEVGFAISQQLPLDQQAYSPTSGIAHQFFANLLPEANARTHIVKNLKITDSDFGLLKAIGGECAGALTILPSSLRPTDQYNYRKITDKEFKQILKRNGIMLNTNLNEHRPRLSLAGAQDKLPILLDNDTYFLSENSAPSSHILKFELAAYRNIPIYEYYLTMLAKDINLPTVEMQLCQADDRHYLLIKRYDRVIDENQRIVRLHQEDFCQALGIGYAKKYQQDGGPSFQDCYQLVQNTSITPIQDTENLLRWQIFNILAGNSDGHAKNLSLIYQKNNQSQLAPFYDLVCTRAVEDIDTNLALSVGGEFQPDKISKKHWEQLADDCNIRKSYLDTLIHTMADALLESVSPSNRAFTIALKKFPVIQRIKRVITKQCRIMLKQLKH